MECNWMPDGQQYRVDRFEKIVYVFCRVVQNKFFGDSVLESKDAGKELSWWRNNCLRLFSCLHDFVELFLPELIFKLSHCVLWCSARGLKYNWTGSPCSMRRFPGLCWCFIRFFNTPRTCGVPEKINLCMELLCLRVVLVMRRLTAWISEARREDCPTNNLSSSIVIEAISKGCTV